MAGYTKEFLIDAFMSRYLALEDIDLLVKLEDMASKYYDQVDKDTFRKYASLDAEALKKYKNEYIHP